MQNTHGNRSADSGIGFWRPRPALRRWDRGLKTKNDSISPLRPHPASCRWNAGLATPTKRLDTSQPVSKPAVHWHEASGAVKADCGFKLVSKPSVHWHRASGADRGSVGNWFSANPHSGFGHHAIHFRSRTPRLRFDSTSDSATAIRLQPIGLRRNVATASVAYR